MPDLPSELCLEVKTSRSGTIPIGERDLDGVGPSGYVVALLNDRLLHGPRWVLVRAVGLQARGYDERQLSELAESSPLADPLNAGWSDWILDSQLCSRLFEAGTTGVAARVAWCRVEHPPRAHQSSGALREVKVAAALQEFRARIDAAASGGTGSQIEGQIHQSLLCDVIEQMGYAITPNPVGVPDIVAKWRSGAVGAGIADRLAGWEPESAGLRAVRDLLKKVDEDEIRELVRKLRAEWPGL